MSKKTRVYSRYTLEAAVLMGSLVRLGRSRRKLTMEDLAARAGISRGLLQRIEKGDPKCEMGAAFEAAALVGVKLFDADDMASHIERTEDKLALLPKAVRKPQKPVDDDF
ncbi:MAG: helix-turn-helix transcriptional regulator [Gammaproteobacteria bacterium]|nr:helix-turn-helix transcriptional regulator [Gammaproteobacteria bacterium]